MVVGFRLSQSPGTWYKLTGRTEESEAQSLAATTYIPHVGDRTADGGWTSRNSSPLLVLIGPPSPLGSIEAAWLAVAAVFLLIGNQFIPTPKLGQEQF